MGDRPDPDDFPPLGWREKAYAFAMITVLIALIVFGQVLSL